MTLTHPPFSIAPLAVAPLLTSPLPPLLLPFLAPGRYYRTLVLTTYQFFYLFLSLRSFAPTSAPLPSIFRKLAGMTLPLTLTVTVLQQRNTRLFLFTSLALNAAKSFISFCRIKSPPKAWWSAEVESAVSERRKAFAAVTEVMKTDRLTSPLLDAPRQSSPRPRLRHGRRLALLSPKSNPKSDTLFALSLAHLPRLLPLLTSPTVLLPGNRLQSMPLT